MHEANLQKHDIESRIGVSLSSFDETRTTPIKGKSSMSIVRKQRLIASVDGDFVVFLVGMRINNFLKVHKWFPVLRAMGRMLSDLNARPDSGLLGYRQHGGLRNHMFVQYWRSFDHLEQYARDAERDHLPAWVAFNRAVGMNGDVGIWHETYKVAAGQYEAIYVNMPAYGLGAATRLVPATGSSTTAAGRLGLREADEAPVAAPSDNRG